MIPNKVVALVLPPPLTKEFGFGRFVELSTAFVALTGVAKIPPKTKDPNTLIPAVCHPLNIMFQKIGWLKREKQRENQYMIKNEKVGGRKKKQMIRMNIYQKIEYTIYSIRNGRNKLKENRVGN